MDVTGMAELAVASWQGQLSQDLGMRMLRQAAQQDAAVVQLVAAAAEGQPATQTQGNLGRLLDVSA
mgnify:CR=1 FL=1